MKNHVIPKFLVRPQNVIRLVIAFALILIFFTSHAQYNYTGSIGMPNYIFDSPVGVGIDNTNGWLYVVNAGANQVLGFNLSTRQYSFAIGSSGSGAGEFSIPTGVVVDNTGSFYVSEWGGDRVQKFDSNGTIDLTFGILGTGSITGLADPNGLAIDNLRDRLYVADQENDRIAIYTRAGVPVSPFSISGLDGPRGVAVDEASGALYISNTGLNEIRVANFGDNTSSILQSSFTSLPAHLVYHHDGTTGRLYIACFGNGYNLIRVLDASTGNDLGTIGTGTPSASVGQFNTPLGIGIDNTGNTYVSEYVNNRIQSFDDFNTTHAYRWTILTTVTFNGAAGVAVNENNGRLYACDYNNNRVQVFDRATGSLISIFSGTGSSTLVNPYSVAIGPAPNYYVYVSDINSRIQIFNSSGLYTGTSYSLSNNGQIAVSAVDGRVYVAEFGSTKVRVFNSNFSTNHFDITVGTDVRGVAIDDTNGRIYAIDNTSGNARIKVFLMSDGSPDLTVGSDGIFGNDGGAVEHQFVATMSNLAYHNGQVYVTQTTGTGANKVYVVDAVTGTLNSSATLGSTGTANGQFTLPVGIDVASDGTIYVGDFGNHRVQAFLSNSSFYWTNGTMAASNSNGALSQPNDVSVSALNSRVYVADRNNHRIQVFNTTGGYLSKIDNGAGSGASQLINPSSVYADGGLLYISDRGNNRIQIFDISSATATDNPTAVNRFGTAGTGTTDLSNPAGVWVTSNRIYVADQSNNRVQVFDKTTYAHIMQIGSGATLNQPTDVAVDPSGNVFVVGNHKLVVFDSDGNYVSTINGPAEGLGNIFSAPQGIFVDSNGIVYITDTPNNRIVALSLCGGSSWATNVRAHWMHNVNLSYGSSGQAGSQFSNPIGIGMDPVSYRMFVADRDNERIQIFTPLPYMNVRVNCTNIADGTGSYGFTGGGIQNDAISLPYDYDNSNNPMAQATFTIENLGNASLTLTSTPRVVVSGTGATSFYSNESNLNGANGTFGRQVSRTFTVRFRPVSTGAKTATVTLTTNETASTGRNAYTYSVTGTPIDVSSYTYIWTNADGDGDFQNANNWSPNTITSNRSSTGKRKWDILRFVGSADNIVNVPADTVGALEFSANANITFSPSAPGNILVIKGRVGTDLQLPAGHELNIASDDAMEIHMVQTGGLLNGSVTFGNATTGNPAHRFIVKTTSVTFSNGASFTAKNLSGNAFGTLTGNNLVVFASGSRYNSQSGSHPFGLAAPNSKVEFQSGSTYSHQQSAVPQLNNRTYAHFEFDYNGLIDVNAVGTVATLQNLTIKQGTLRVSANQPINLTGSLQVDAGSTLEFDPNVATDFRFVGTTTQSVTGTGTFTFGANASLKINNSVASTMAAVQLGTDLTIPGALVLEQGDLNLNGSSIDLAATGVLVENLANGYVVKDNTATFDYIVNGCIPGATGPCVTGAKGGSVSATSRTVSGAAVNIGGLGLYLADAAGYDASVVRHHYRGDGVGIQRVYTITSTPDPTNTTLEIRYADENVPSDITDADLTIFRRLTGNGRHGWDDVGYTSRNSAANLISVTGVTGFSDWTSGSESTTLPIELVSFDASMQNSSTIQLRWSTDSELNNEGFEIEKSFDGKEFTKIGYKEGKGTTSEKSQYTFYDSDLGPLNYYRLKQLDFDGTFSYSNIKLVRADVAMNATLIAWPNPFSHSITLLLKENFSDDEQTITLRLTASNGRLMGTYYGALSEVNDSLNREVYKLEPGLYLLHAQTSKATYTLKILKND